MKFVDLNKKEFELNTVHELEREFLVERLFYYKENERKIYIYIESIIDDIINYSIYEKGEILKGFLTYFNSDSNNIFAGIRDQSLYRIEDTEKARVLLLL